MLNDVCTYGGKDVIKTLVETNNTYTYVLDVVHKTKDGYNVDSYDHNGNLFVGGIYKDKSNYASNLEIVAHETFHALQDEEGQAGPSIYNEVEAYVFENSIVLNWLESTPRFDMDDSPESEYPGAKQDNVLGNLYLSSFERLSSSYDDAAMFLGVMSFKKGAAKNRRGIYDKMPLIQTSVKKSILQKYYPRYENN